MAISYVYSGAGGAGTGADWANAFTTLQASLTAKAAGDTHYVAHDHAETTASAQTITLKGNSASPDRILCVNRAGSVPPVAADLTTGASITTTGTSGLTISNSGYWEGITFNCGTGAGTVGLSLGNSGHTGRYRHCAFNIVGTSVSSRINIGGSGSNPIRVEWVDCSVSFGATSQGISSPGSGSFFWRNRTGVAAITGATIPTTLLIWTGQNVSPLLSGLDLSALGSGKALATPGGGRTIFVNCKLGASVTIANAASSVAIASVDLIGCHSTGIVRRDERYDYKGTLTTETTIVRTGGASDGITAFSHKIVTTANAEREFPFESFEGTIWNDAIGSSKTLTVHCVTDNVTLTNAEAWLEVDYLGDPSFPISYVETDEAATILTTPASQATSTETWTTTGLTTPVYQKLEVSFTPEMEGPIRWRVKVAKVSTTVYVCPKAELT